MVETLTVFDDVFVPTERIFLDRDTHRAGQLALTFVEYHRFTAVSYKLPLIDCLVGLAVALAEANGIERAGHVRDKLITSSATRDRPWPHHLAADASGGRADRDRDPDPLTTNLASGSSPRLRRGGRAGDRHRRRLLVTGPSGHD